MRQIKVRLAHLPPDSACARVGVTGPHWTVEAHLLDEVRMVLSHSKKHPAKPHPQRPSMKKTLSPTRKRQLAAARARSRARREALEEG